MAQTKKPIVRLEHRHMKSCRALGYVKDGTWSSPWALGTHVFRDARGCKRQTGAHTSWISFRCNSVDCPGVLLLKEHAILEEFQDIIQDIMS